MLGELSQFLRHCVFPEVLDSAALHSSNRSGPSKTKEGLYCPLYAILDRRKRVSNGNVWYKTFHTSSSTQIYIKEYLLLLPCMYVLQRLQGLVFPAVVL